jgi:hypothetical protein
MSVRNRTSVPDGAISVARRVRNYLDSHPPFADAVRSGVVNYTAMARRLAPELGVKQLDAIVAACRRYPKGRGDSTGEEAVRRVLRKSRIESRSKVAAITAGLGADVLQRLGDVIEELLDENLLCRVIQVSRGTVILVDEDSVARVTHALREGNVVRTRRHLVEVAVTSPDSIEETPGLLRLLTGLLAAQGINIVEALSCYTDTIFLLDEQDLSAAIACLTQALA